MDHGSEVSRDGKRNAFHIRCDVVGHSRAYAACADLCEKRKHGELGEGYTECSNAIQRKTCPALSMMKEEQEKGQAIYFIERVKSIIADVKKGLGQFVSNTQGVQSKSVDKSSVSKDQFDTGNYADAFNAAQQSQKPVIEKIETKPGESLFELAKRITATRKETT